MRQNAGDLLLDAAAWIEMLLAHDDVPLIKPRSPLLHCHQRHVRG
jgi:hypothetical protein